MLCTWSTFRVGQYTVVVFLACCFLLVDEYALFVCFRRLFGLLSQNMFGVRRWQVCICSSDTVAFNLCCWGVCHSYFSKAKLGNPSRRLSSICLILLRGCYCSCPVGSRRWDYFEIELYQAIGRRVKLRWSEYFRFLCKDFIVLLRWEGFQLSLFSMITPSIYSELTTLMTTLFTVSACFGPMNIDLFNIMAVWCQ